MGKYIKIHPIDIDEINNLKLYNYGAPWVKPCIEENEDDIFIAVKYKDHGDEFLYIETINNEAYEYGWYLNRVHYPEYKELLEGRTFYSPFIRNPEVKLDPSWVIKQKEIQEDIWHRYFEDDYIDFEDWNNILAHIRLEKNHEYGETISGKKKFLDILYGCNVLYGDEVQKIWINPKYSAKKKVYVGRSHETDYFGESSFVLNLKLFRNTKGE